MFLTAVVAGCAVGATDLGWIIGGMIDWAGPQDLYCKKQLQLMHAERRRRQAVRARSCRDRRRGPRRGGAFAEHRAAE